MSQKPSLKASVATDASRGEQILTLKGKLIGSPECYELLDETRERVQDGLALIILDMTAVDMINSAGAGILAAMITSARRQDGKVCLMGLGDRCRKVLEFMHLDRFTTFCNDIEQARTAEN